MFGYQAAGVAQSDGGGDVQAAAEYGSVAGGAAAVGYKAFYALVFEIDGVGGGEVVCDEDGVVQQVGFQIEFGAFAN